MSDHGQVLDRWSVTTTKVSLLVVRMTTLAESEPLGALPESLRCEVPNKGETDEQR